MDAYIEGFISKCRINNASYIYIYIEVPRFALIFQQEVPKAPSSARALQWLFSFFFLSSLQSLKKILQNSKKT